MNQIPIYFGIAGLLFGSFFAGAWLLPRANGAGPLAPAELGAEEPWTTPPGLQGREPPPPNRNRTSTNLPTKPAAPSTLVYPGDSFTAGSNNGFIAVTGSYGVGTSVLYVLDTVHRQLAVYEARGGTQGSRRLFLVGARRIDLDLQIESYNDESEYSYRDLQKRFEASVATDKPGEAPAAAKPETPAGDTKPATGPEKR
jgi:hypothetical protein